MANRNVDSTITLNIPAIIRLDQAAQVSLEQTADAIMTDIKTRQIMPFDTGTLQNDSTFLDTGESGKGHVEIVSATPYARRLYYHPEYHFSKEENPDAGGRWFDDYVPGGKKQDFARETFARLYKRNSGV